MTAELSARRSRLETLVGRTENSISQFVLGVSWHMHNLHCVSVLDELVIHRSRVRDIPREIQRSGRLFGSPKIKAKGVVGFGHSFWIGAAEQKL